MLSKITNLLEMKYYDFKRLKELPKFAGDNKSAIQKYINEIESSDFFDYLKSQLQKHSDYKPSKYDLKYTTKGASLFFGCSTLYALVRSFRPDIIVETGGCPGKSSSAILKAIDDNGFGKLYTCDLPPKEIDRDLSRNRVHEMRPAGITPYWIIPEDLLEHRTLVEGDTKSTLGPILDELGSIDIFIHDSLHTYDHMIFEFETAWDHVRSGGLIISDDIYTNESFFDFAKKTQSKFFCIGNYGVMVKG